ncbi:MAG: hypothetical protein ACRYFU_11940 [Janthinobacterium lividum]
MNAGDKKLNEMNRLTDMGHFPALVNAGATVNILATLAVTWWLERNLAAHTLPALQLPGLGRLQEAPPVMQAVLWTALILILNVTPVVLLRLTLRPDTPFPTLRTMNFVHDQHKFSDWVYLAASANMAFWILTGWAVFSLSGTPVAFFAMLVIAALATFSPVLLRKATGTDRN